MTIYGNRKDEFDSTMEHMSKNKDIERGLVQITAAGSNHTDPVVREMASAVLHEIDRAKRRRAMNNAMACCGLVFGIIIIVILVATGTLPKSHR